MSKDLSNVTDLVVPSCISFIFPVFFSFLFFTGVQYFIDQLYGMSHTSTELWTRAHNGHAHVKRHGGPAQPLKINKNIIEEAIDATISSLECWLGRCFFASDFYWVFIVFFSVSSLWACLSRERRHEQHHMPVPSAIPFDHVSAHLQTEFP